MHDHLLTNILGKTVVFFLERKGIGEWAHKNSSAGTAVFDYYSMTNSF